jgi:hypothetical protein
MVSQQDRILPKLQESTGKVVGLISDTHVPVRAREIPKAVFKVFENADYIVHAGDLVELSVIDDLEKLAPVLAVYGNMDGPEVRGGLQKLNSFKVFNWKIGVIHDAGTLFGIRKAREIANLNGFDVLVYGHTHNSSIKWNGDILFINPGSPTNPLPSFIAKPSVALLRVTKERIVPELIQI